MNRISRILALLILMVVTLYSYAAEKPPAGLDELVENLMAHDAVPGLALVIVKDGQVVVAKGYGTRIRGKTEPVNADTLFGLASTTKAFTATALGMLVDQGTISFDSRVADVLPGFRVADPYVSANATIRDLLAHRTGTDSADMLWYANHKMSRGVLMQHLGDVPQAQPFRSGFVYSSLMYVAAGRILFEQTGKTWEEFTAERIFQPLGMDRTTTDMHGLVNLENVASAHISIGSEIQQIPHSREVNTGPAGLIYSSANDVGRWLKFLLDGGAVNGEQLLATQTLVDIMSPHFVVDDLSPFEELIYFDSSFVTTGLGWFISDYRGRKSLSHTGGIDGMAAFISLLPSENLGIAVLANLERNMARVAIRNWIYDQYLGANDTDWVARYSEWSKGLWARIDQMANEAANDRDLTLAPSLPLASFAGRFHDQLVGELEISLLESGSLSARMGDIRDIPMEHWQADTFRLLWSNQLLNYPIPSLLSYELGADGVVSAVKLTGPAEVTFRAYTDTR